MKILTLNTWQERGPWRERWELILRGLAKYNADIVGFQEVFNMEWAEEARKRSGYPYLAVSGEHSGLVFLSKFRPVEQECHVMKTRSPHEDYLRYAFYVRVDTGKEQLPLFNTHLSWKAEDQAARMGQALELVEFVKQKAGDLPSAVIGDFNTASDTVPVVFLKDSRKWVDAFAAVNPWVKEISSTEIPHGRLRFVTPRAHLTWDYRNSYAALEWDKMAERRIDYIFVTKRKGPFAHIRSAEVVFNEPEGAVWPSDHFGVLVEFFS